MKTSVNLNSSEWCDIVFEGRNKSYGAYAMRQSSAKRHIVAFGAMLLFVAGIIAIPTMISTVKAATAGPSEGVTDVYGGTVIEIEVEKPKDPALPDLVVPEPPKILAEIKFVPPVIVEDANINPEKEMHSQDQLMENPKIQIGRDNNLDGSLAKDAISAKELREHNIVVEAVPTNKEEGPITFAEVMPQFPGGEKEMYSYINDNLKYPVVAQESGIQGKVTIRFVVGKNGEITNVTLLRGIDPACDKEAMRVVKSMPRWIAGKQNGTPVQVFFTLPISFRLRN